MVKDNKHNYKYTEEFGYIPKEWNVLQLRSLIDDVVDNRGKTPPISNYGIPLLEIASMENNRINYSKVIKYLDDIVFQSLRNHLKRGDVLFSTVGAVGEVSYYDGKEKSAIAQNIIGLRLKKANPLFITFLLSYSENKKIVKSIEMNQVQPSIKVPQLLNLKFVIPTIKEQEKIAEVLNDVDSLIEKTQQLIEKKKNLKIATMQKLLTPKKDWEVLQLGSLIESVIDNRGKTPPLSNYGIPLLEIAAMENNRINYLKVTKYINNITFNSLRDYLKKGDVLLSTVGAVGEVSYYDGKEKSAIAQNIIGLRFKKANPLFITFLLSYSESKKLMKSIQMNQAQPSIKVPQFLNLKFNIPNVKEQEKIATILSDMDKEIENLEQELAKYKDLKTGMMQELLTGKVRLI